MKNRQLAELGLGLLGVVALLQALSGIVNIAATVGVFGGNMDSSGRLLFAIAVPVALLLGVGYILVFHNAQVATALFPDFAATTEEATPELARILVALTGVLLLGVAIPGAIAALYNFLFVPDLAPNQRFTSARVPRLRGLIEYGVQVWFALYLIMRPERLLEFLRRPPAVASDETAPDEARQ
jgi:hypothetical protein